jgi:hypothetical protein
MDDLNKTAKCLIREFSHKNRCYNDIAAIRRKKPDIWNILVSVVDLAADNDNIDLINEIIVNLSSIHGKEILRSSNSFEHHSYINKIIETLNKYHFSKNFASEILARAS